MEQQASTCSGRWVLLEASNVFFVLFRSPNRRGSSFKTAVEGAEKNKNGVVVGDIISELLDRTRQAKGCKKPSMFEPWL